MKENIPFDNDFSVLHNWNNAIRLSMPSIWHLGQLTDLVDKGLLLLYRFFNHLLGIILFESCYSYSACNCSFLGFFCIKAHSWKCYVNLLLSAIIRMNDSSFHLPLWSSLIFNSNGQHAKCMLSVYESLETCTLCRFWMLGNDPYLFIKIEGNVNWRQIQV